MDVRNRAEGRNKLYKQFGKQKIEGLPKVSRFFGTMLDDGQLEKSFAEMAVSTSKQQEEEFPPTMLDEDADALSYDSDDFT